VSEEKIGIWAYQFQKIEKRINKQLKQKDKEIERLNKIINEIINAYNNQDYANLFVLLRKERKERLNIDREW